MKLDYETCSELLRDIRQAKNMHELNTIHDEACLVCMAHGSMSFECHGHCVIEKAYNRRKTELEPGRVIWKVAYRAAD